MTLHYFGKLLHNLEFGE